MATVTPTKTVVGGNGYAAQFDWALTTANNDGSALQHPEYPDRVFSVAGGTWGGATLTIEGSSDGTTYVALEDVNGNAATLSGDGVIHVQACPQFVRPRLTTVGAGAAVPVAGLIRRVTDART